MKEDSIKNKKRIFVLAIVFLLGVISVAIVFGYNVRKKGKQADVSKEIAVSTETEEKNIQKQYKKEEKKWTQKLVQTITKKESSSYSKEMSSLKAYMNYNEDVVGMIRIKDTVLYHPVMRSEYQEDFYLKHDLDKKYNSHGVPFVSLASDFNKSGNSVLYGHNITLKTRDVFCDLAYYSDVNYYKEHPIVEIVTEEGVSKYLVFAYYLVDLSDKDSFLYSETTSFESAQQFEDYMANVSIRNHLNVPCDLQMDDCYITLSSCSNELHGSGTNRMVVMAKKLDEGEEWESVVENAKQASNPLMPEKLR